MSLLKEAFGAIVKANVSIAENFENIGNHNNLY